MSVSTVKPRYSITRWLTLTALGYAVFVAVSLWLPIGLHRIVVQRKGKDWWKWPVSYSALAAGTLVWIATGRQSFGVVVLLASGAPWASMLVTDFCTLWAWQWPFQSSPSEYLGALDQRLKLKTNASLFVIVAVAMLFLARVA